MSNTLIAPLSLAILGAVLAGASSSPTTVPVEEMEIVTQSQLAEFAREAMTIQLEEGKLTPYDDVMHSDLGIIAEEYFAARSKGTPEVLRQSGLVANENHVAELRDRWSGTTVVPEKQPFAVSFYSASGRLGVSIYTWVTVDGTVDAYGLHLDRKGGRWILRDCVPFSHGSNLCRVI